MSGRDYYKSGENNVICDQCGFKYKANELRKQWDGLWVCKKCFDKRNPQDFVRGVKDDTSPNLSRPRGSLVFTDEATALDVPEE